METDSAYTLEEKQLISDWRKKLEDGAAWIGEGIKPDTAFPVFHRVATKDLIINHANGIADKNPLWRDENYARNTRWGGIIAPPLFPCTICAKGPVIPLDVPPNIGKAINIPWDGERWEFYKPVYEGDSFKVRFTASLSAIPHKAGPKSFRITTTRKYINQNDEVVCIIYRSTRTIIQSAGDKPAGLRPLPSRNMQEYRYNKEELDFIDRMYDEEERRGADTRYWEDVNIGDDLQPIATGPVTPWDQVLEMAGRGVIVPDERELRKKAPSQIIVDPVTGISHNAIETHFVDSTTRIMGGDKAKAHIGKDLMNGAKCRLITNWMGNDGFLKVFEILGGGMVPMGETFFSKGKVTGKRIENGEHLVDLAVWLESIRGHIVSWAAVTVSLYSKKED